MSMSEFNVGETVGGIVDGLVKVAESVTVIGEPIEAAGKVIIPAVLTRVGFGAGGGGGTAPAHLQEEGEEEASVASGSGGGGGGGLLLTPIFLVVDAEGERLITVPGVTDIASAAVSKVREALDRVLPRRGEDDPQDADEPS